MGGAVARHIATRGFHGQGYDLDPPGDGTLRGSRRDRGAALELAADADMVLTSLPTTAPVTSTVAKLVTKLCQHDQSSLVRS